MRPGYSFPGSSAVTQTHQATSWSSGGRHGSRELGPSPSAEQARLGGGRPGPDLGGGLTAATSAKWRQTDPHCPPATPRQTDRAPSRVPASTPTKPHLTAGPTHSVAHSGHPRVPAEGNSVLCPKFFNASPAKAMEQKKDSLFNRALTKRKSARETVSPACASHLARKRLSNGPRIC